MAAIRRIILVAALLCFASLSAHSAQYNPVLPTASPYPGLTMIGNINSAFQAFLSGHAGASPPSYGVEGTIYTNSSSGLLEFYTGSNWVNIGIFTTTQFAPFVNGAPLTCPSTTGSSNAYVLTYSPAITALVAGTHYCFVANFGNTSTATLNINGLGAKAVTKRGTVALASADIPSGAIIEVGYDGTEFQMLSQLGNAAAGTVTSVTCGTGLAGGTFTTSGTCGFATIANGDLMANTSGGVAAPSQTTLTAYLDAIIGSTRGGIIERGASGWTKITPGTTGTVLTSNGASADPSYQTVGGGLTLISSANASAVASVSFGSSFITSTYKKYVLEWDSTFTSAPAPLCLSLSSNNGSTILTANNYYWTGWQNTAGSLAAFSMVNIGAGGQAAFQLTGTSNTGSSAAEASEGTIKFSNPSATAYPEVYWNSSARVSSGTAPNSFQANGTYDDSGGGGITFNFVQINTCGAGGTITGHFALYGLSP